MCDVLDKVENKGKAEGKIEGTLFQPFLTRL